MEHITPNFRNAGQGGGGVIWGWAPGSWHSSERKLHVASEASQHREEESSERLQEASPSLLQEVPWSRSQPLDGPACVPSPAEPLLPIGPWVSHPMILSLRVLLCELGIMGLPPLVCCEDYVS